jgi:hypothetical protein
LHWGIYSAAASPGVVWRRHTPTSIFAGPRAHRHYEAAAVGPRSRECGAVWADPLR